jgi:hypothetical protein
MVPDKAQTSCSLQKFHCSPLLQTHSTHIVPHSEVLKIPASAHQLPAPSPPACKQQSFGCRDLCTQKSALPHALTAHGKRDMRFCRNVHDTGTEQGPPMHVEKNSHRLTEACKSRRAPKISLCIDHSLSDALREIRCRNCARVHRQTGLHH